MINEVILCNAINTAFFFGTLNIFTRKYPNEIEPKKICVNIVEFVNIACITISALIMGGEILYNPNNWHMAYDDDSIQVMLLKLLVGWYIWHSISLWAVNIHMLQLHHWMMIALYTNGIISSKYHGAGYFTLLAASTAIQRNLLYFNKKQYLPGINRKLLGWSYVAMFVFVATTLISYLITEAFVKKVNPFTTLPAAATALPCICFVSLHHAYKEAMNKIKGKGKVLHYVVYSIFGTIIMGTLMTLIQAYRNGVTEIIMKGGGGGESNNNVIHFDSYVSSLFDVVNNDHHHSHNMNSSICANSSYISS